MNNKQIHWLMIPLLLNSIFLVAQNDSPLAFFEPVIGDWYTIADEETLRNYPEIKNSIGFKFEWADPHKKTIRFYEAVPEEDLSRSILECFIARNPRSGEIEFQGYQKRNDFLYKGRYEPLKTGKGFLRIYEVHYPPGTKYANKRDEKLQIKTYRTICKIDGDNEMICKIEQLELGIWVPWGSGKPWYLKRKNRCNKSIPAWVLDNWKKRTQESGIWVANNSGYKSKDEPYDKYGLQWEYGLGQKHLKGRLFVMKDNKEVGSIWQFTEFGIQPQIV
ncbi:MAG: hypothetical protein QNJ57_05905 [Flavobacteriaceae bacterium]|nr:hypothetical protein [Flavobacteriaceae bacterium]